MPTLFLCYICTVEQEGHGLFKNYANLVHLQNGINQYQNGFPPWSWLRGQDIRMRESLTHFSNEWFKTNHLF